MIAGIVVGTGIIVGAVANTVVVCRRCRRQRLSKRNQGKGKPDQTATMSTVAPDQTATVTTVAPDQTATVTTVAPN